MEAEAAVDNRGSLKNEPQPKTIFLVGGAIALNTLPLFFLSTFELVDSRLGKIRRWSSASRKASMMAIAFFYRSQKLRGRRSLFAFSGERY